MIQANELRVGNYVDFSGNYFKIHTLSLEILQVSGDGIGGEVFEYKHLNPIPLTAEILGAAGWYWSIYHQAFHFGDPMLNEFFDLNECYPSGYQLSTFKKGQLIGNSIFYLHQLQNLYFALTGEELKVNLSAVKAQGSI